MPCPLRRCLVLVAVLQIATAGVAGPPPSAAPTDDALRAFAGHYADAVNDRDVDAINACLNLDSLIARSHRGVDVPPQFLRGFDEGIRAGLDWGRAMATGLGEDGHYALIRTYRANGEMHAIFRLVNGHGGLNYHDLLLNARPDGRFEILDVYIHLAGEMMSETVQRSLRQFVAALNKGDDDYVRSIGSIRTMATLAQEGRCAEALDEHARMPARMQRDKAVMILRISCAAVVDADALDAACTAFRETYPGDASVDLLTVDQLVLRSKWEDAIAAFERIRAVVGDDAYLDDLIANVYRQRGMNDEARVYAERSIAKEPTLDEGYWTLLEMALEEQDHVETATLLATLQGKFGWEFRDLETVDAYRRFVRSPEYDQWLTGSRVTRAAEH
jgi:tetratricopeptide (TPR) repeat protein